MIYNLIFLVIFHLILPAAEMAYYAVFLEDIIPDSTADMMKNIFISGSFAAMNYFAMVWIFKRFFAEIFLAALAFGVMFAILTFKKSKGFMFATTIRYAISIGVLILSLIHI